MSTKYAAVEIKTPHGYSEGSDDSLTTDGAGNLNVNIAQGSFSVSSGAQYNSTPPTYTNGTTNPLQADANGKLLIAGTINASSAATVATTPPTYSNATSNSLVSDAHGSLRTSPSDASGNAMGVLANALRIDPTGTTTQPVSISGSVPVTGTFWQGTQPVSAAALPLPSGAATSAKQPALGTAGSASADVLTIQGIASMTALKVDGSGVTQPVSGTFWQGTQPVSASALPLPSGAATSAKQPALGTAGSASADVLTIQGIASMTALKVDGSGVTQPVSGTVTVNALPTGSNVIGTVELADSAGTNKASISAGGALKVDNSAVTQPVKAIAPTLNVGQVSIATTATQIIASNANRTRLLITNTGTTDVLIGNSGVTTSTGHKLKGIDGYPMVLRFTGAVYGIVASGTQTVTYAEETT